MPLSQDVRAAIGTVAIEITWIEYLVARLVTMASGLEGDAAEERMGTLLRRRPDLTAAHAAVQQFEDPSIAARTAAWLDSVPDLRAQRHSLVHSIVMQEHRGGFTGYWPRQRQTVAMDPVEVADLATRVMTHSEEGTVLSIFEWPAALGLTPPSGHDD